MIDYEVNFHEKVLMRKELENLVPPIFVVCFTKFTSISIKDRTNFPKQLIYIIMKTLIF